MLCSAQEISGEAALMLIEALCALHRRTDPL
jgi:hypothetical protein